jgi:PAS domain S-box-containing protein
MTDSKLRLQGELLAYARQQEVIAELARLALATGDVEVLFERAVEAASDLLRAPFCRILEVTPDRRMLVIRAAVGWSKQGRSALVELGTESQAGYALTANEPVIAEDLHTETRFNRKQLLREFGLVSGISVVISGRGGDPFGVLEVHSKEPRAFSKDDSSFLQTVANVLAAAIDRHRSDDALRESEDRYRRLVDLSPDAIFISVGSNLVYANRQTVKLFGASRVEEILSMRLLDLVHPDERQVVEERIHRILEHHEPNPPMEQRWTKLDGTPVEVEVVSAPLTWQGRLGIQVIMRDISERKRTEMQLRTLNETLEQRVAERTEVAERQARQLRLLTAELTQAEQRERRRLAQVLHDHLQQLLVAAKLNIGALAGRIKDDKLKASLLQVDDLLHQSIDASRSLTIELSPPILYDAGLAAAVHWLARWMQEKHGLTVVGDIDDAADPDASDVRIILFEIVRELLFNVVKHAGVQTARIDLSIAPSEEGDQVQIVVSDAGVGFDPESSGIYGGSTTGFGLFNVRHRLELLGGYMEVESTPGVGTRVLVRAPLHSGREEELAAATAQHRTDSGEIPINPEEFAIHEDGEKIRIVLADDQRILRAGLARLLRDQPDIEVVGEAYDGQMAFDMAREMHPDVVVMDISMPKLNGIEATRKIASELPEVRVIGLSMHEEEEMAHSMFDAGAAAYLSKGGPSDALIAAIRACKR